MDNFNKFVELVKDQFSYGGKKYALDNQREATDVLFDRYGFRWLIGTIDKYTFRFANLARERDILKIATYMYLLWLKRGFFLMPNGINDPAIDTNLEIKQQFFDKFVQETIEYHKKCSDTYSDDIITLISGALKEVSEEGSIFTNIDRITLIDIFNLSYLVWNEKFSATAGKDTDTWHPSDKKD